MQSGFKHPQVFADLLAFCQAYYPLHSGFPKPFRFTLGERILQEIAEALRHIVLANAADKGSGAGRRQGAAHLKEVRAGLEVIRGYLLLAWKLRFLSHAAITELETRLEGISKQTARWQQWFERTGA
ncbi:four helix bundle protein [Halomonas sp. 328]|uniref:four helix bundle protein n=1 Tax=Halomonas sp. 328 TaxID=2776704 RepID=UPI0018A6EDEA|nr:four helix bundle protein [Halomonas sp. 328]MBF8224476.1 four helix bundle protein [Halomonas sp. 328]